MTTCKWGHWYAVLNEKQYLSNLCGLRLHLMWPLEWNHCQQFKRLARKQELRISLWSPPAELLLHWGRVVNCPKFLPVIDSICITASEIDRQWVLLPNWRVWINTLRPWCSFYNRWKQCDHTAPLVLPLERTNSVWRTNLGTAGFRFRST